MTKAEIVNEISKKTGIDKATVLTAVEAFMESVKESLIQKEDNVYLRGSVVSFLKKELKRRLVIFPRNTTIIIDEHNIPAFKPAKVFVDAIKK